MKLIERPLSIQKGNEARKNIMYNFFSERFIKKIHNDKLKRKEPLNHSPVSVINSNKYIINTNSQTIFILTPTKLFEELIHCLWKIALEEKKDNQSGITLLEILFTDEYFRNLFESQKPDWLEDFENFKNHIKEESFLYFDNGDSAFLFNLYRIIEDKQFTGGILHLLTRHFNPFVKYNKSHNGSRIFSYKDLMWKIIITSLIGNLIITDDQPLFTRLNKETIFHDKKKMIVGIYYDKQKELNYINTAYIKSI